MDKLDGLLSDVASALDAVRETVQQHSDLEWIRSHGFLPVIRRACLRRQFDALEAVIELVRAGRGYAAVPLLRPACEELIWITYLDAIPSSDAERLVVCSAGLELLESLRAQDSYAGRTITRELGLLGHLQESSSREDSLRVTLTELGKRLGWDQHTTDAGQLPRIAWVAKKGGHQKVYKFLFHATSRFVHFSLPELLRRAWVRPGSVSIRSTHFGHYWSAFALYWGFWLLLHTLIELTERGGMSEIRIAAEEFLGTADRIGRFGQVPIVTAEELAWPSEG